MTRTTVAQFLHKEFAPRTWVNPTSLEALETALDTGKLYASAGGGRWWLCRRNGATKLWVTRPEDYRIPIKYGFKNTGRIENGNWVGMLRIADSRQEAEHAYPDNA